MSATATWALPVQSSVIKFMAALFHCLSRQKGRCFAVGEGPAHRQHNKGQVASATAESLAEQATLTSSLSVEVMHMNH
jgi:hypothetical protein